MDKIEAPVRRKRLLPGQFTLDEALAKAAGSLVEDALKAMAERDREYAAWKKAKGDAYEENRCARGIHGAGQ